MSAVWVSSVCGFFYFKVFRQNGPLLLSALILLMYYPDSPLKDRDNITYNCALNKLGWLDGRLVQQSQTFDNTMGEFLFSPVQMGTYVSSSVITGQEFTP